MANPQRAEDQDQTPPEETIALTEGERRVLAALENAKQPLDTIAVASSASLGVEEAHAILQDLKGKGVIEERPPEPIRERFQVDEDALARVAG